LDARTHGPLDALFRPPAVIAALLAGEAVAAILALAPGAEGDRWVRFGLASLGVQWTALGTLTALYLLRVPLARLRRSVLAWTCLMLFLAMALLVALAAWFLSGLASNSTGSGLAFVLRLLGIAVVVGLLGLVAYQNYADAKHLAIRAKQAELEALQARVHPHFLFNTLNSAAALVHARPDDAERVLLDLGDLFRAALSEPGWVPLSHELELCRRYLAIEQQRFGERLRVEWRIDEGLEALSVPLLTIQPLVENAVVHGLDERSGAKSLSVEAIQTATELLISVRNAVPRDPTMFANNGHSIGLAGVRARIESVTHGTGTVTAESDGVRFVARVALPKAAMPAPAPGSDQTTTR
jgi:two-component system sensor histidine kinase AlgZ